MKEQTLIGLSLSGCIRDMADGKVDPERVKCIIAGTKWDFPTQLQEAIDRYTYLEWRGHGCSKAAKLLEEFWYRGKIIQPRVLGLRPMNIAAGRWATQSWEV